jgi:hypothetical protein
MKIIKNDALQGTTLPPLSKTTHQTISALFDFIFSNTFRVIPPIFHLNFLVVSYHLWYGCIVGGYIGGV